jgi:hypothetical protein
MSTLVDLGYYGSITHNQMQHIIFLTVKLKNNSVSGYKI